MKEPNLNSKASGLTPGVMLKAAREEQGLSIVDVAARLCLSAQLIEDIERDDYSHMAARVYARGHVMSYAHLLGIPEQEVVTALANVTMEYAPAKNPLPQDHQRVYQSDETSQQHSGLLMWGSIIVLVIVVGLVMLWWKGSASTPDTKGVTPAPATNSTETPSNPPATVSIPPPQAPAAPAPVVAPVAPSAPANPVTPPASPPSSAAPNNMVNTTAQPSQDPNPVQPSELRDSNTNSNQAAPVTLPPPRASADD